MIRGKHSLSNLDSSAPMALPSLKSSLPEQGGEGCGVTVSNLAQFCKPQHFGASSDPGFETTGQRAGRFRLSRI